MAKKLTTVKEVKSRQSSTEITVSNLRDYSFNFSYIIGETHINFKFLPFEKKNMPDSPELRKRVNQFRGILEII